MQSTRTMLAPIKPKLEKKSSKIYKAWELKGIQEFLEVVVDQMSKVVAEQQHLKGNLTMEKNLRTPPVPP